MQKWRYAGSWRFRKSDARLERLQAVLLAALETRGYSAELSRVGLGNRKAILRLDSVDTAVAGLPRWCAATRRARRSDYRNARTPLFQRPKPLFPLEPAPRIVSLDELGGQTAEVVASPVQRLRALAAAVARGEAPRPRITRGLVALVDMDQVCLTEEDRDLFWQVFQVPVFEQWVGPDGQVLAADCEVHAGPHVLAANAIVEVSGGELVITSLTSLREPILRLGTGREGAFAKGACACGSTAPRVWGVKRLAYIEPPAA